MRKIFSIFVIMVLLIIIGCSNKEVVNHNYIYKGENDLWSAEYKVNGAGTFTKKNGKLEYKSKANNFFTITYKKDLSQLSSTKHLEISYKSSVGGGKLVEDYNDGPPTQKIFTLTGKTIGGAIENKNEVIEVTINLDGKIQTIELKNGK